MMINKFNLLSSCFLIYKKKSMYIGKIPFGFRYFLDLQLLVISFPVFLAHNISIKTFFPNLSSFLLYACNGFSSKSSENQLGRIIDLINFQTHFKSLCCQVGIFCFKFAGSMNILLHFLFYIFLCYIYTADVDSLCFLETFIFLFHSKSI